ncbi:MAG: flexitail domain-containing putative surface protein, partial [Dehalococcoidia bacterium]
TNPLDADSDDDGLSDGDEVNTHATNPLDADSDDDGLSDGDEVNTHATNPLDADSDDDAMRDPYEVAYACGLDPLVNDAAADADADGLANLWELGRTTDPCMADTDGDRCTDGAEVRVTPGSEETGGRRDPMNPWDFYDTDGSGAIDLFHDIFGVASRYGLKPADAGYAASFDRSAAAAGQLTWEMGPPDGTIDLFTDIFGVTFQYGHHCT